MGSSPAIIITVCLLLAGAAAAQTPTKTARVGTLCGVRCAGAGHTAFYEEMRKLGWTEGENLVIERRDIGLGLANACHFAPAVSRAVLGSMIVSAVWGGRIAQRVIKTFDLALGSRSSYPCAEYRLA